MVITEMGSTVSIYNETEVPLNIALCQVSPLYYQNLVRPGHCATFKVGKVWFTIEGRVWNGDNEYDGIQVTEPIIEATAQAITIFMTLLGKTREPIAAAGVGVGIKLAEAMSEGKVAHETDATKKLRLRLFNGKAIHSPGWYFGKDRCISISGGPKCVSVDDSKIAFGKIDVDTLLNPFVIRDRCIDGETHHF
ncbi:uncharacterized protein LOC119067914 [Bradysia coprophila]|uniref:uncharacterized protein LOC119067914 n=1 Tax=Bradysia coprophila TaxID=38358 RepID=UPI00187DCA9D|nr:uncharacterized protein LOC119067914 [Bradysia coprophila]